MMQGGEEAEEDPAESQPTSEPVPSAAAMFLPTATVKRRQADVAGRVTIVEERVPLVEAHVQRLVREGFSREQCVEALDQEAGDLVAAARRLFEAFGCPKSPDNQTDSAGAAASASRAGEGEDNINAEADYYVVLGLAKDATQAQIKKSYYKLALRYHPDKSSADDAEAKFKIISQAYQVLSDPQKRQEYDQFGRESVEGSTVFADAKRHFALMFGGAAFQPFIGEMTMAFVSQLSQPEDEVEKVRQEMELLRFQQLKKKKLAQLLVERARGLIQKSGGRENFLYQARALRDELRKEPGADRLLQAIGWCYENAGLQVYRTHFGISGTFGGIGGHFMKLNKGFNSLKGRFQTIGSVFKVIGGAAGAASAMAAADELPTEQQEAERARIEAHMQTLMEDTIWSISKMEIQDTLWTAVENGLDGISVSETSKEGGTNTKSDTEDGKAASPPDRFEQKYLCEAVVLLGQLFQELPKTDPVGTEDKGPGNDSNSSAATASPPAAVPQRPEVVLPSHWLQLERPKPKPQPKVVSFFQNIFKKKQPQSPSSASTAAPAAAAVDQGSSNSVPVDSGSKPLPVDATSDVTI